jgi:hypothetical protein
LADHVSRRLGEPGKVNFDANGNPTGYDGSVACLAAGTASLSAATAANKKSKYDGVGYDKTRKSPNKWFARLLVPYCILGKKPCASAALKCGCRLGSKDVKSSYVLTEELAAAEYNKVVGKCGLNRPLNVLN